MEQFENSVINASSMTALSAILLQDLIQNQARFESMRMMLIQRVHILHPCVHMALHYATNTLGLGWIITKDKKRVKNHKKTLHGVPLLHMCAQDKYSPVLPTTPTVCDTAFLPLFFLFSGLSFLSIGLRIAYYEHLYCQRELHSSTTYVTIFSPFFD